MRLMTDSSYPPSWPERASWCIAAVVLTLVLWLHLLPALLAGLLVYELVHVIAPRLQRHISSDRSRIAAVVVLSTAIVGLVTVAIFVIIAFFRSDAGSLPVLLQKMADIIESARNSLPGWLVEYLPDDSDDLRETLSHWLREHAPEVRVIGAEAGRLFAHILVGSIIGAIVSLSAAKPSHEPRPLARALSDRARRLGDAFRSVVFAQVRISAINTGFTAIYLVVVLPALGIDLPLVKTLIGVTFVTGLLPVVGNLVSNTVIVVVSLAHSLTIALASLAFLVVIHKLEYFLNARIIGSHIQSRVWELLLAMLLMEAAFGLPGLVAAPIYYAYLKRELSDRALV